MMPPGGVVILTQFSEVGQVLPRRMESFPHASTLGRWLGFTLLGHTSEGGYSRVHTDITKYKTEGALEKGVGHVKEAADSLSGNKVLKAAEEADKPKGTFKKKGVVKDRPS
jgi:uncharacterized protein YjbJ (UPF0337 family)